MKNKSLPVALTVVAVIGAGGYGLYQLGMNRGMQMTAPAANARSDATTSSVASKPGDLDPTPGKRVLYWHDPMVPGQKFDKPGKSPFMDMQLVPVYADGSGDEGKVSI